MTDMSQILRNARQGIAPDFNDPAVVDLLFGSASSADGVLLDGEYLAAQKAHRELLARAVKQAQAKHVSLREALQAVKGGAGSGNFGHAGRPGEVGGSSAGRGVFGGGHSGGLPVPLMTGMVQTNSSPSLVSRVLCPYEQSAARVKARRGY
jgi:hypothetical protein